MAEPTSAGQQLRDLTASMANFPLFAMLRSTARPDLMKPELIVEHLHWMMAREGEGKVFASGPYAAEGAAQGSAGGLTLLRAADAAEAKRIGDDDPLIKAGAVTYEMRKWVVMEGDLQLRISLSRGRAALL